jgi:methionine sulfoxide reductase heme-binding subunit
MSSRFAPLILAAILSAKAIMVAFLLGGDFSEQLGLAARYTARASFLIFLITYSASSLRRLWPNDTTRLLIQHRRQWGLGFALAHTVHLAALAYYNIVILNIPGLQALLGGGLAYGLMFVMAMTSNNASMKAMGIWWKRVHTIGIHWIWFIFFFSYLGRIFDAELRVQGVLFTVLCLAALGLRAIAWLRARQQVPA